MHLLGTLENVIVYNIVYKGRRLAHLPKHIIGPTGFMHKQKSMSCFFLYLVKYKSVFSQSTLCSYTVCVHMNIRLLVVELPRHRLKDDGVGSKWKRIARREKSRLVLYMPREKIKLFITKFFLFITIILALPSHRRVCDKIVPYKDLMR
jgi:hypothetical protein